VAIADELASGLSKSDIARCQARAKAMAGTAKEMTHSPGRLIVTEEGEGKGLYFLEAADNQCEIVAMVDTCCGMEREHARRLAAGWNALIGIDTDMLASIKPGAIAELLKHRAELIAVADNVRRQLTHGGCSLAMCEMLAAQLKSVLTPGGNGIARAKGGDVAA
jgi:hypothetical protein